MMVDTNSPPTSQAMQASSIQLVLTSASSSVAEVTKEFIADLFYSIKQSNLFWIEPRVTITSAKNVNLEWWQNGKFLALSINSNGDIQFVKAHGSKSPNKKWESETLQELETGQQPSTEKLVSIWKWLVANSF